MEKELNDEIANYFLTDSRVFLDRYLLLKEKQTQIANRAKLMIDLVFSMECSLKAILFFQSVEDEKKTYKKVRTHDLKKLLDFLTDTSQIQDAAETIRDNIDHFYVGCRYTLDANIHFRGEAGDLSKTYYDTIANPEWLEKVYRSAKSLYTYAGTLGRTGIVIINFNEIDIDHELEKFTRLKALA